MANISKIRGKMRRLPFRLDHYHPDVANFFKRPSGAKAISILLNLSDSPAHSHQIVERA